LHVSLAQETADRLQAVATEKGTTPTKLKRQIIDTVLRDGLVAAVIDAPPKPRKAKAIPPVIVKSPVQPPPLPADLTINLNVQPLFAEVQMPQLCASICRPPERQRTLEVRRFSPQEHTVL
jgi:hypothetical protein